MSTNHADVAIFHERFGFDNTIFGNPGPRPWDDDLVEFRYQFMQEELAEFMQGVDDKDHAQMADALIDLVYIALGTAHFLGYPWQALWEDVQRANMAKVKGVTKRGNETYDVTKPEGWEPPRTREILKRYGF